MAEFWATVQYMIGVFSCVVVAGLNTWLQEHTCFKPGHTSCKFSRNRKLKNFVPKDAMKTAHSSFIDIFAIERRLQPGKLNRPKEPPRKHHGWLYWTQTRTQIFLNNKKELRLRSQKKKVKAFGYLRLRGGVFQHKEEWTALMTVEHHKRRIRPA